MSSFLYLCVLKYCSYINYSMDNGLMGFVPVHYLEVWLALSSSCNLHNLQRCLDVHTKLFSVMFKIDHEIYSIISLLSAHLDSIGYSLSIHFYLHPILAQADTHVCTHRHIVGQQQLLSLHAFTWTKVSQTSSNTSKTRVLTADIHSRNEETFHMHLVANRK